jgi:hypothetical protein
MLPNFPEFIFWIYIPSFVGYIGNGYPKFAIKNHNIVKNI